MRRARTDKLKKNEAAVRTGGKGSVRRKKKVTHQAGGSDSNKLAATLKRNGVNQLPGCEEATLFRNDGKVLHFTNPKVQASVQANTYYISGKSEEKNENDLPSGAAEMMQQWQQMAAAQAAAGGAGAADEDDTPDLVEAK